MLCWGQRVHIQWLGGSKMKLTGTLELIERVSAKGQVYYHVKVNGQSAGNAFSTVVAGFRSGDRVTVTYEEKGNFKNVTELEMAGPSDEEVLTAVVQPGVVCPDIAKQMSIPHPKGFEPHPILVNEKSLYLALQLVNNQEEAKKLTKKSLMTRLSVAFELAKPIKEYLVDGKFPDGLEQLTDEEA